eukprot:RCo036561
MTIGKRGRTQDNAFPAKRPRRERPESTSKATKTPAVSSKSSTTWGTQVLTGGMEPTWGWGRRQRDFGRGRGDSDGARGRGREGRGRGISLGGRGRGLGLSRGRGGGRGAARGRGRGFGFALGAEPNYLARGNEGVLYVGNCPDNITDADIHAYYASLGRGAIKEIVWGETNGTFQGFGHVIFTSKEHVESAMQMAPPVVNDKKLLVSNATSKVGPITIGSSLAELKQRRALMGQSSAGIGIVSTEWTPEMLQSAPFRKDFTERLQYLPRSEAEYAEFARVNSMKVSGDNPPKPVLSFDEVDFGGPVMDYLKATFKAPTPIQ